MFELQTVLGLNQLDVIQNKTSGGSEGKSLFLNLILKCFFSTLTSKAALENEIKVDLFIFKSICLLVCGDMSHPVAQSMRITKR